MLLDSLDVIRSRDVWDYLPLILVAIGVTKISASGGRPSKMIWGGVLAGAGTVWFLDNLGLVHLNGSLIWPVVLIGFGGSLLARNLERERSGFQLPSAATSSKTTSADGTTIEHNAVFASSNCKVNDQDFLGGEVASVFSGVNVDLTGAKMKNASAELEANAVFGGIDIRVPSEWIVSLKGVPVFGAYEDKSVRPPQGSPELVVTGAAVFGGVNITN